MNAVMYVLNRNSQIKSFSKSFVCETNSQSFYGLDIRRPSLYHDNEIEKVSAGKGHAR